MAASAVKRPDPRSDPALAELRGRVFDDFRALAATKEALRGKVQGATDVRWQVRQHPVWVLIGLAAGTGLVGAYVLRQGRKRIAGRLLAMLAGFFGVLALLLAGVGLYGVTSYAVGRRRTEMGIRMALGAAPAAVLTLVLRRVAILVAIGVVIGGAASVWASRYVATLLFGLTPGDPATVTGAALVLTAIGAVAGWMPARRASRIDPARVLREG